MVMRLSAATPSAPSMLPAAAAPSANTTGPENVAVGYDTLTANTDGGGNVAVGYAALYSNTTGGANTALGNYSLDAKHDRRWEHRRWLLRRLPIAPRGIITSISVTRANPRNRIPFGSATRATQKNTFIAGISGATVAGGVGVLIDSQGHLGTNASSARFKEAN